ncbi:MAG TPA: MBL fold metallo-hydrolase [Candidatus Limnocylindrales bacterium]|jgi:ribonuclease BN (tRNA processing enzyme)|nr:MBL fold metallo-hydrolase [Candidatus Limnocylindrales bacterium]
MELIVLGGGPAYTNRPGASGAAYLVRHGGKSILLDLGQGSFPALASRIEPSTLRAVLVSHLHPDHFIDLVSLRHYLRFEFRPPRRVRVLGPAGLGDRIDALHAEPGFSAASLDIERLTPGALRLGSFRVTAGLVTHTDESYAFRVATSADRPGLVYSGDCGRAADLLPLVRPGDTLLSEISFGAGPVPKGAQHLDGPAVGGLAAEAGAGRVLLTHIQMGYDQEAALAAVRARFNGPVDFVAPGLTSEV